jgi:hypothetical protein
MTRARNYRPSDFTTKLYFCKGCHTEIHPDIERCLVCGTMNAAATPPSGTAEPAYETTPAPETTKKSE